MAKESDNLVSIIVPVFNTAPYLYEAIESVLNQTHRELEVICINDGSTDNSQIILEELSSKDDRITIINNQENMGLSATRNIGINISRGKYIYFFDSDDKIAKDMIESCLNLLEKYKTHVVFFESSVIYDFDTQLNKDYDYSFKFLRTGVYNFQEIAKKELPFISSCMCLIEKNFLINNFLFFENDILHEDELFSANLLFHLNRISVLNKKLYIRRLRAGSIVNDKRLNVKRVKSYNLIGEKIYMLSYSTKDKLKRKVLLKRSLSNYVSALKFSDSKQESLSFILKNRTLKLKHKIFIIVKFIKWSMCDNV